MNFKAVLKRIERITVDHSPEILTAFGVVGTLTTAYLTGKASIKAYQIIEGKYEWQEFEYGEVRPLELKEIVQLTWREFVPASGSAVFTIAAIVASNRVSNNRAAALAVAYSISEKAFVDYREKVVDRIGENDERKVRDELAQDRVDQDPVSDTSVFVTGDGSQLCYDSHSGRYFESSVEAIRKAEIAINFQILHDGYASLSDFYDLIGLGITPMSEELGWNNDYPLTITISAAMAENNKPAIVLNYDLHPRRKFDYYQP